ncbi:MAG: tRNA 5-methylaminomethyl-2-thiouridine biosynthesis bifunctional protein MnmC [Bacteroidota bacterium]|jgi:tRNA U34 5-methylaminomethyl-2-thiouridine-forming methyltransferase MnmC
METSWVVTGDGSRTLFNASIGEHYHSKHGAFNESRHVFLESGLCFFLGNQSVRSVSILEVGFGTGLNFLLSGDYCTREQIQLNYTGIEAHPLNPDVISQTGYQDYVRPETWERFLSIYPHALKSSSSLNDSCNLFIDDSRLSDFITGDKFDIVYFDAFAAIHQPEMWTTEALERVCKHLKPGGVFVTYAITGNLKRSMKSLGFSIEKAPGAPGKREMLRAIKH